MHKNVLVAVYRILPKPAVYVRNKYKMTHAYFPRNRFDEVVEARGWVFGRKGRGYIALFSQKGYRWQTEGKDKDAEIIADARRNIWVCELGREETHGSFRDFRDSISRAKLDFAGSNVSYSSPSCGEIRFGWRGGIRVNGKEISLRNPLRYENPYSTTRFDPKTIEITKGDEWLRLELDDFNRSLSSSI